MAKSKELAPKDVAAAELEALQSEADALADEFKADLTRDEFNVPMLVLVQATSKNPPQGSNPGDFVNALTGENYGTSIEFIIAAQHKGRFYSEGKGGRAFSAQGPVVPNHWPEKYRGQNFADLPDAEEQFRERVNTHEISWESGPPIATTHNFVGLVGGHLDVPVRMSLMKASVPTATKLKALLRIPRAPWDRAVTVESFRDTNKNGEPFQNVKVELGRETDAAERLAAVKVAQGVKAQNARFTGDESLEEDRAKVAEREGALDL